MAFEAELDNPWDVYNLDEFLYFCCPECEIKKPNRIEFVKHACVQINFNHIQKFIEAKVCSKWF